MRFEVIVKINGVNKYLETSEYASFPINYNIADIADISKKNSSYSKTLSFPDTKNNRKVFEYIFSIQSDSTFDPTKKSRCWILKDTLLQLEGFLQLTDIVYDNEGNRSSYNCVIYADNGNLFTNIGEKLLSDLDLSQFDHFWTLNSVTQSWTRDYTNGYYYPLIDYGFGLNYWKLIGLKGGLNLTNFLPSYYVKPIIDQIILEAGYSYTSDFLNGFDFKQLVIPFNNKNLIPELENVIVNDNGILFEVERSITLSAGFIGSGGVEAWGSSMNLDVETTNPGGYYNTVGYNYTQPTTSVFSQNFVIDFELGTDGIYYSNLDDIYIFCKRSIDPNTGITVSGWSNTPSVTNLLTWPDIPFEGYGIGGVTLRNNPQVNRTIGIIDRYKGTLTTEQLDGTTINRSPLKPGEEVRFFFARIYSDPGVTITLDLYPPTIVTANLNLNLSTTGAFIETSKALPQNVKQRDFLTSIMKAFNLYIEPDKDNLNNLIIEPRDDYYRKYQTIKDWSDKLDVSKNITSQILSNTQKRINYFTYKEDKDYYNSFYKTNTGQVFGEYRSETNNEFTNGENKVELIFSPTPLEVLPLTDVYLPIIVNNNNGNYTKPDGMNPRMLYKDLRSYNMNGSSFALGTQTFSFYPYAGPINDPINPTYSLNFGQVDMFYEGYNETINNLFFNYYQNQIEELNNKNARLITAYFKLDAQDISSFRFSDLIYFKYNGTEGYYRVNKIMDYDPSVNMTTKVELITAIDYKIKRSRKYTKPIADSVRPGPIGPIGVIGIGVGNIGNGVGVVVNGDGNSFVGPKSLLFGDDNSVSTLGSVGILGDSNQVSGEYILNTGLDNRITGNFNFVSGQENQISVEYGSLLGIENTSIGRHIYSIGNKNELEGRDIFNIGSSNNLLGRNLYNFGLDNDITSSTFSFAIGRNISITGSNNSYGVGRNITITQSNIIVISNDIISISASQVNISGTVSIPNFKLSDVLSNGDFSGGNNIVMTSGDLILGSQSNTTSINMNQTGFVSPSIFIENNLQATTSSNTAIRIVNNWSGSDISRFEIDNIGNRYRAYIESKVGGNSSRISVFDNAIDASSSGSIILNSDNIGLNRYFIVDSVINTFNATPDILYSIAVTNDSILYFNIIIKAIKDDFTLGYSIVWQGAVLNDGGTLTFLGLSPQGVGPWSNFTTASSNIVINGTNIEVEVTGEASTNITWSSSIQYY